MHRSARRNWEWVAMGGSLLALAGCQLYEPVRYERLKFATGAPRVRVLMIGNSLTYYNDLPGLLGQLSVGEERPIQIESVTVPLASLRFHRFTGAAARHIAKGWDVVILQEFSRGVAVNPAASAASFKKLSDQAHGIGSRTIVFENWARRTYPQDAAGLESGFALIARDTGSAEAPVGKAWRNCAAIHPEIALFVDDRHPSEAGTYLAACVLYRVIYGKPATRLPVQINGLRLEPGIAHALQQVADSVEGISSVSGSHPID